MSSVACSYTPTVKQIAHRQRRAASRDSHQTDHSTAIGPPPRRGQASSLVISPSRCIRQWAVLADTVSYRVLVSSTNARASLSSIVNCQQQILTIFTDVIDEDVTIFTAPIEISAS